MNIGSLNIDKVYSVDHFVQAGETILSDKMEVFMGGKGFNQSLSIARSGSTVYHAGMIGQDGEMLREALIEAGADTGYLRTVDQVSGHAVIQLTPKGQNCIIVYGGANTMLDHAFIDETLRDFGSGDLLLMQNEVSEVPYMMQKAKEKGMKLVLNPSPVNEALKSYPLELVDLFILNEVEGCELAGCSSDDFEVILDALCSRFPNAAFVLTVGKQGAHYRDAENRAWHGIYDVPVVDTTGAGDTFCGYFVSCTIKGMGPEQALEYASLASSIAVSRKGAGPGIPTWAETERFREEQAALSQ